jgi:SAM-dependent methyltransferase
VSLPFRTLGPTELLPRYVFAESLFLRRRVLEVGAVASTAGASARFLRTRGARSVLACDDDAAAVAAASQGNEDEGLRFRACLFDDLEPGSFDVLLVADLAPYVRAPGLLAELLRLRAPHGHLVAGLRNPGGLALARLGEPEPKDAPPTYGQALDALAGYLPSVEVATQAAVLGYQLAFDRGEGLQVDGTLGGPGDVAYYVLVAGEAPAQRCEPVWVQLPPEPLAYAGGRVESQVTERDAALKRVRALGAEAASLSGERDAAVTARAELQGALDAAHAELGRLLGRVQQLESAGDSARGVDALSLRVRQLEQSVTAAEASRAEAEADVQRARTAAARAQETAAEWTRDAESSRRREQVLAEQMRTGLAAMEATRAERDALLQRVSRLESEGASGQPERRAQEAEQRAAAGERELAALREQLATAEAAAAEARRVAAELSAEAGRLRSAAQAHGATVEPRRTLAAEQPVEPGDFAAVGATGAPARADAAPPVPEGCAEERARLEARVAELERQLRERNRAYDALSRTREETEARFQNSEQALRSLREALDAAAAQGR